ncbi:hypothetical protein BDD43_3299 [Mucilaginibacter gracilis]|uniref:Uncharacterized protein n=1 Tax=Mucilaginibacter gracilis TaxID=423350 RepID=A0A495J3Z8_9SPHI|nr:hypothetical protein [Mucilaginibacter gracilis]RKR83098.1 hypothetical protein BDD43_3299 [Mucilaginibacter gracilis]
MKDFVVLCKPLKFDSLSDNKISADMINVNYLMNEANKIHPSLSNYEIDPATIKIEMVKGVLCVIFIAFKTKP